MKNWTKTLVWILKVIIGCVLFGAGFNLFLSPNGLNAGGVSGLGMVFLKLTGISSIGIGTVTMLINLPLFVLGGMKLGKSFVLSSLLGMVASSIAIDALAWLPVPQVEPLLAALYGGVFCGFGLGLVFSTGATTGGSDILVRLLKRKFQHIPIGTINSCFDFMVAALTGLAFQDAAKALYSGVSIFVTGWVIDAVVYRFDYSKVALIITKEYARVAQVIGKELDRGATYLEGQGVYSGKPTKVVLTAVKKHQIADLKRLVVEIDKDAFIIVQEAHQVLGDGFSHYSKDEL